MPQVMAPRASMPVSNSCQRPVAFSASMAGAALPLLARSSMASTTLTLRLPGCYCVFSDGSISESKVKLPER